MLAIINFLQMKTWHQIGKTSSRNPLKTYQKRITSYNTVNEDSDAVLIISSTSSKTPVDTESDQLVKSRKVFVAVVIKKTNSEEFDYAV